MESHTYRPANYFSLGLAIIVLFGAVFGPKVWGYVDISVIASFIGLSLLALFQPNFFISKQLTFIFIILAIIVAWSVISWLINSPETPYILMRTARASVNTIALFSVFYFFGKKGVLGLKSAFVLIAGVLLVNTLFLYLQIIFPQIQSSMAYIFGFDKSLRELRAFGLTAGYDSAGYIAAFLAAALLSHSLIFKSKKGFLLFMVASGAVFFTSRTSMVLFFGLVLLVLWFLRKRILVNAGKIAVAVGGLATVGIFFVLPLIQSMYGSSAGEQVVGNISIASQYAQTEISAFFGQMVALPESGLAQIVGTGTSPAWSDIGYIQTIFLGGWVLLAAYILFYVYLLWVAPRLSLRRLVGRKNFRGVDRWQQVWCIMSVLALCVLFLGNLKNLYFFTRGYHELFVVIGAIGAGVISPRRLAVVEGWGKTGRKVE